jgi:hypothetical protein
MEEESKEGKTDQDEIIRQRTYISHVAKSLDTWGVLPPLGQGLFIAEVSIGGKRYRDCYLAYTITNHVETLALFQESDRSFTHVIFQYHLKENKIFALNTEMIVLNIRQKSYVGSGRNGISAHKGIIFCIAPYQSD